MKHLIMYSNNKSSWQYCRKVNKQELISLNEQNIKILEGTKEEVIAKLGDIPKP